MKRFLAFGVVTLILGSLLALIPALIDSVFATESTSYSGYPCWLGPIINECYSNRWEPLLIYPLATFFALIPGYLAFRAVVGSFKVVFGRSAGVDADKSKS
jgi:hypothetical protein